jgi:hypothetical protein
MTRSLAVARSMLAISALQLLLLAAAALVLAGRLLTSHRGVETALLGSRGAAGWQLARITVAEIAVVAGSARQAARWPAPDWPAPGRCRVSCKLR